MNQVKFDKIKGLINRADCIKNELVKLNYFEPVDQPKVPALYFDENGDVVKDDSYSYKVDYNLLFDNGISEEEKINFINNLGERLSYICELYLKALILPHMHFDGIETDSDEELEEIFNGKKNIKNKYSHYFSKMLSSTATHLPEKLRESILVQLGGSMHDDSSKKIYDKYMTAVLDSWLNEPNDDMSNKEQKLKEQLIANSVKLTDQNSDSYPQSRYSMFTDYIADIDYLFNLSNILNEKISHYIPRCLDEPSIGRHIFPDVETSVIEKLSNGNEVNYFIDSNGKIDRSSYYQIADLFPGISDCSIVEIDYVESGIERIMKFDSKRGMFVQCNKKNESSRKL